MEIYTMNMHCENCKSEFTQDFKRGVRCQGLGVTFVCKICGCQEAVATSICIDLIEMIAGGEFKRELKSDNNELK